MEFRRRDLLRLAVPVSVGALGLQGVRAADAEPPPAKRLDVIYKATPFDVVDAMLTLADLKADDVLYDLGSGDGRIVVTAARRYGARAVGYEIDPPRVRQSRALAEQEGVSDRVTIRERDLFEADLSPASVVTLYLLPTLNVRLMPRLACLRPGARVVSHSFAMKGARPTRTVKVPTPEGTFRTVFLWVVPWDKE